MKIKAFVNFPEDMSELEDRVAAFHATLLVEKIKQLHIDDKSKKKLFNLMLNDLQQRNV